ncbi:hypothetical protein [Lapidilactobacillus wuchangensis]|uniref:hypothetical protein n=1 Tax=Lapidilactobacillus wuchangensis TaxID=2486001 RepID=UPI000F774FC0|nr:hypothetical protein [Lapidilactobacillus wuchangensis]
MIKTDRVPDITASPYEDENLFTYQEKQCDRFWWQILSKEIHFAVYYKIKNKGSMILKYRYTKSPRYHMLFQLTSYDTNELPISHFDITRSILDGNLLHESEEIMMRMPYSDNFLTYYVKLYLPEENK